MGAACIRALTINLVDVLAETSMLALRLAAPFLSMALIVNFALGMGNRFAQQLSVYHATTGVVILGGFLLLYAIWIDWIPDLHKCVPILAAAGWL